MAKMICDTIDFSAYIEETEASVRVRKASQFVDDLVAHFAAKAAGDDAVEPSMSSTKLCGRLNFRPGELTAWAGYNGHRKSMFVGQVALDLCAQKQRVLIVSLEMQPRMTLARMARQASAVAAPSPTWLQAFAAWTDDRLWLFDHVGRISPALCIAVLRYFADELKGTQVVIDSMMMVCGSEERLDEQKQFTTDLVRVAQETELHIHLVTHCRKPQSGSEDKPPTKYDLRGSAAISDQAHNVVTVWANKAKVAALEKDPHDQKALEEADVRVAVEKQRNGSWEGAARLWFDERSFRFCDDRTTAVQPYAIVGPV